MGKVQIETIYTVSTAHITKETAEWLDTDPEDLVVYRKEDYGWFIAVGGIDDLIGIPGDLVFLIGAAIGADCDWLQIDRDVKVTDGLLTFEW